MIKPHTRKFGHAVAKYSKNPRVKQNATREAYLDERKRKPITKVFESVRECLRNPKGAIRD